MPVAVFAAPRGMVVVSDVRAALQWGSAQLQPWHDLLAWVMRRDIPS